MAKIGIKINWKEVDDLIQAQNTAKYIAGHLKISEDTFHRRLKKEKKKTFADYAYGLTCKGQLNYRTKRHDMALNGNTKMLSEVCAIYLEEQKNIKEDCLLPNMVDFDNLKMENAALKTLVNDLYNKLKTESKLS